jgi:hypothetical protein
MKLELDIFSTNMQVSDFLNINPVRAELLYAERERERYEGANSHISKFCESALKQKIICRQTEKRCLSRRCSETFNSWREKYEFNERKRPEVKC